MLQTLHTHCIFFSIAGILLFVECGLQPCPGLDLLQQLRFCPVVLQCGPEIPGTLPVALTALQDSYILCPAQLQGQFQQLLVISIGTVEFPHPPQVTG